MTPKEQKLLDALISVQGLLKTCRPYMPKSIKNTDRFSFENISANVVDKTIALFQEEDELFVHECDACHGGMNEGYCVGGGSEYYCSEECLHTKYSAKEWEEEMYEDGGDNYWTDWDGDDKTYNPKLKKHIDED